MVVTGREPTLVAGIAMGLLAAWVLYLRPSGRTHRAFALFLLIAGLLNGLSAFTSPATGLAGSLRGYMLIALPFAAINFGYVYLRTYGPAPAPEGSLGDSLVRWSLLATVVVFEVAYLADHALLLSPSFETGPFTLFLPAAYLSYAIISLALAVSARYGPTELHRRGLRVLSLGFALEPSYRAVSFLLVLSPGASYRPWLVGFLLATVVLVVLSGLVQLRGTRRSAQPRDREVAWWFLAGVGLAAGSGVLADALFDPGQAAWSVRVLWTIDGVWELALVLLATHAVLRFRLFDLDRKVQQAAQGGTLATGITILFFGLSEGLEALAPIDQPVAQVLVAGLIVAALTPLRRLARRVVDRLDGPTDQGIEARKHQVYAATVELVALSSDPERSARRLPSLREELELADEEAHAIEARILGPETRAATGPASDPTVVETS